MAEPALASASSAPLLLKLLVVGDVGVGKTSLIRRMVHNAYTDNYKATIGVDFLPKIIEWRGRKVNLQLWDIAGQERFGNMTRVYYKEAVGAFIVYDKTDAKTFNSVETWKSDIENKIQLPNGKALPIVLLANKCDLSKEKFFAVEKGIEGVTQVFDTSAKEATGFNEAIQHMINMIFISDNSLFHQKEVKKAETVSLPSSTEAKSAEFCSC